MNYIQAQKMRKQATINWTNLGYALRHPLHWQDRQKYWQDQVADWQRTVDHSTYGTGYPVRGSYEPGRPAGSFKPDTELDAGNGLWNNLVYNNALPSQKQELEKVKQALNKHRILK